MLLLRTYGNFWIVLFFCIFLCDFSTFDQFIFLFSYQIIFMYFSIFVHCSMDSLLFSWFFYYFSGILCICLAFCSLSMFIDLSIHVLSNTNLYLLIEPLLLLDFIYLVCICVFMFISCLLCQMFVCSVFGDSFLWFFVFLEIHLFVNINLYLLFPTVQTFVSNFWICMCTSICVYIHEYAYYLCTVFFCIVFIYVHKYKNKCTCQYIPTFFPGHPTI